MKICSKCNIEKENNYFEYQKRQCKNCRNKMRNERNSKKEFSITLLEKICGTCKIKKPITEYHRAKRRFNGVTHDCKNCRSVLLKNRYERKKESIKIRTNEYYYKNKEVIIQKALIRQKERLKTDPKYLLIRRLRNRLYYALKKHSWKKDTNFARYIGCELDQLKMHIERQFTEGMSWENQGQWHVDHIIPLDSAQTEEALYNLCHYENLQPMWAKQNLAKGAKFIP